MEPEDFWQLGRDFPYGVNVSWSEHQANGYFDVVLWRQLPTVILRRELPTSEQEEQADQPNWNIYANNPLQKKLSQQLIPTLRELLEESLPYYMVPSRFMLLESLPLTPNGKLNRKQLPDPNLNLRSHTEYVVPQTDTEQKIAMVWKEVLQVSEIGIYDNFFEVGGNSLLLVQINSKLQEIFDTSLTVVDLLEYPNIHLLSQYINDTGSEITVSNDNDLIPDQGEGVAKYELKHRRRNRTHLDGNQDIAIIGLSGHFPGASNIDQFWQNIREGVESVKLLTEEELIAADVSVDLLNNPNYVRTTVSLPGIDQFDADFFDYSPKEAREIDPQQRLFFRMCLGSHRKWRV